MKIINRKCNFLAVQKVESVVIELDGNTAEEQVRKVKEELTEVEMELLNEKYRVGDREKTLEELFDLKQAVETLMYLLYLPEHVKEYAPTHVKKMADKFCKGVNQNADMPKT
jgi:hypothetical protein